MTPYYEKKFLEKFWGFSYTAVRSPFGRLEPQPLFFYIFVMKKQKNDLEVRLENLNELLNMTIRYGEKDLERQIRYMIGVVERELKILKVRMDN